MRIGASRGSHLPILIKLVQMTNGPILELGVGYCSSPFLHWACFPTRRRLVSYENDPRAYPYARSWIADFHEVHCITDWDSIDISEPWTIGFVDHHPNPRRQEEVKRLLHADYVVLHDSESSGEKDYHFNSIRHLFKYRYKYTSAFPYTSIWSNKHDVRVFEVK